VWSDAEMVLSVIGGVLQPTLSRLQFSPQQARSLAVSILSAFTASIVGGSDGSLAPYVKFEAVSSPFNRSCLLRNTLLLNIPYRDVFSLRIKKKYATIAIFEASLEIPTLNGGISLEIEQTGGADPSLSLMEAERQTLEAYANIVSRSGVEVLFCQKRIHAYLNNLLERRGIMTIQRVSIRYVSALARLSGARLLGELAPIASASETSLPASTLGFLKSVQWKAYCGKYYLACEACEEEDFCGSMNNRVDSKTLSRMLPVMTVFLCGLNESSCIELKDTCEKALKSLNHCLRDPYVLEGAGHWQHTLGRRLLEHHFPTRVYAGCEDGATSERFLGQTLVEFAEIINNQEYGDAVSCITSICADGKAEDRGGFGKHNSTVFDPLATSLHAVECAVEAACCILDIDGVVFAESAQQELQEHEHES
jgi:chaperonin GroEL (HSP60 family)